MTTTATERQRSYISQFAVQLGLFTVQVELVPVRKPNTRGGGEESGGGFTNVCPDCSQPVHQSYSCDTKHGPYTVGQLAKCKETADGLVRLSIDDIQAIADADVAPGILELSVCKTEELLGATMFAGNSYRLRPAKKAPRGHYALLQALISDPGITLYGMARLNARSQGVPFILTSYQGQVVLSQVIKPQDMAPTDELGSLDLDPKSLAMAQELRAALLGPLNTELFESKRADKLAEVMEARAGDVFTPTTTETPQPGELVDLLQASLDAAKKSKPTRKTVAEAKPKTTHTRHTAAA